ncbi:hypothetical protein OpiT1DRAFT_03131 [Opitutaceae bacterium TAV1]|nr:hypothetical protein OpiT1DRAFT_03131 [Opitutaceae bacterium TAV1]
MGDGDAGTVGCRCTELGCQGGVADIILVVGGEVLCEQRNREAERGVANQGW